MSEQARTNLEHLLYERLGRVLEDLPLRAELVHDVIEPEVVLVPGLQCGTTFRARMCSTVQVQLFNLSLLSFQY